MLRIQQGVWHKKVRTVIVFEGFDAAGKGGAIRKLTEVLDPRSVRVYPIGAPDKEEQAKHWLFRFWAKLPEPGTIAVFDRSWYGRVLVERVDELATESTWKRAYEEINQFEKQLTDDGIRVIKIFLVITKEEQLSRFEDRLRDPYKQWKITEDDLRARRKWDDYVLAVDEFLEKTHQPSAPWHLVPANDKFSARHQVLSIVTSNLHDCESWLKKQAKSLGKRKLKQALSELGKTEKDI